MAQEALQRQTSQPGGLAAVQSFDNGRNSLARLNMRELKEVAEIFIASGAFTDVKQTAQAMVKIIAGQELGFSPIVSMTGVHFFNGKVSIGANLQASLIKSSGKYDYKINEHTADACEIAFYQVVGGKWEPLGVPVRYTMADAQKAQLAGKDNWKKFGSDMLFAACIRQGTRRYCADVLRGITADTDEDINNEQIDRSALGDEAASASGDTITVDGEIVDTSTGEVIEEAAPAAAQPQTPEGSVKTAVGLAYKLQKEFGVDIESLSMQFLPDGVSKFSALTEEQAAEAVPGLAELLTAKVKERR